MRKFRLSTVSSQGVDQTLVMFSELVGLQARRFLAVSFARHGRLISIAYDGKQLHHRGQKAPGGRRIRMPSAKLTPVRDAGLQAVAFKALRGSVDGFPLQDFDL
jgi:hypothetical protein